MDCSSAFHAPRRRMSRELTKLAHTSTIGSLSLWRAGSRTLSSEPENSLALVVLYHKSLDELAHTVISLSCSVGAALREP